MRADTASRNTAAVNIFRRIDITVCGQRLSVFPQMRLSYVFVIVVPRTVSGEIFSRSKWLDPHSEGGNIGVLNQQLPPVVTVENCWKILRKMPINI